MVKVYTQTYTYDYPFPTVTLAYFLRYPNPYSRHVLSTDVIDRSFDPVTQRLCTTRLHLKRSKLPSAVLKLLPRSLLGANSTGTSQAYILERSTVDVKEGWMRTESRNLELTGVLSVVEKQVYRRPIIASGEEAGVLPESSDVKLLDHTSDLFDNRTDVTSTVTLHSHLGQRFKRNRNTEVDDEHQPPQRFGFLRSWSQASLQRSIEAIGLSRTSRSQPNAKEGMKVVLERLREGGLVAVLDGMRRDGEAGLGLHSGFRILGHGSPAHQLSSSDNHTSDR